MARIENDEERRKWLDAVVELKMAERNLADSEDGTPIMIPNTDVHIYNQVIPMASAVGADLDVEDLHDREYPYRYSFVYKGVGFFGLSKERLERHEGV